MVAPSCGAALRHEIDRDRAGDMLQHHLEAGEIREPVPEPAVDEHRLAVEHVDRGIGLLAMDQERHADLLHARQHRPDLAEVGDARGRVCRGVGRINLHRREDALAKTALDLVGARLVGHVAGHERLEFRAFGQSGEKPRAVRHGVGDADHRRHQVRHDDAAPERARRERQARLQHGAVAHVQVPVVGATDGDALRHRARQRMGDAAAA